VAEYAKLVADASRAAPRKYLTIPTPRMSFPAATLEQSRFSWGSYSGTGA